MGERYIDPEEEERRRRAEMALSPYPQPTGPGAVSYANVREMPRAQAQRLGGQGLLAGAGGYPGAGGGGGGYGGEGGAAAQMEPQDLRTVQDLARDWLGASPEDLTKDMWPPIRSQIDVQYGESEEELREQLARSGMLGSGYGQEALRGLGQDRARTASGAFGELQRYGQGLSRQDMERAFKWLMQLMGQGDMGQVTAGLPRGYQTRLPEQRPFLGGGF